MSEIFDAIGLDTVQKRIEIDPRKFYSQKNGEKYKKKTENSKYPKAALDQQRKKCANRMLQGKKVSMRGNRRHVVAVGGTEPVAGRARA